MTSPICNNRIFVACHTLVIAVGVICFTIVLGLAAILRSFFTKTGDPVHLIARFWGRCILWIAGIRVTMSGVDGLDPKGPYIFMANHQSNFDIPVLLSALPFQFRWLAKAELFKIPIFGRGMRGAGYISIDRSDRKSAFHSLDRAAQSIRNGSSVVIFPEGTRSPDGQMLSFKKGGFVLAVDAGVPIIPMIIRGTLEIMPKGSFLIRTHRVHIEVLPAIDSSLFTRKTKDQLLEQVRSVMGQVLNRDNNGEPDA
jgi:1-acyl-sn-glycerol-3-phosphate acyltransferase